MMESKLFGDLNLEKKVLKPFKIEDKLFFPIVEIMVMGNEKSFNSLTISPVAFVVEENSDNYVIPVNEDEIDEEEILELFFNLK
ncbi:MAG TPA: hypothetical protein VK426_02990 [Methanobacterium sp.]|nr:hypothetical protein [Methanobacterium sp.]